MLQGTCQICERKICIRNGVLCKHGHDRSRDGKHTSDCCKGSLKPPYEFSVECCKQFQKELFVKLNNKISEFEALQDGSVRVLFSSQDNKDIHPGHHSWNRVYKGNLQLLEIQIDTIRRDIQKMESLIGEWHSSCIERLENYFRK